MRCLVLLSCSFLSVLALAQGSMEDEPYGIKCGYGNDLLPMRLELSGMLANQDTARLQEWLWSESPAQLCYAVEGLRKLNADGLRLSKSTMERLADIEESTKGVWVCIGCMGRVRPIHEALRNNKLRYYL